MYIFNSDLDNTLVYSYKHNIGSDKINVEIYNDREISYITKRTSMLLNSVTKIINFVPTTTRTVEQYKRINLGIPKPKYALVCNGGILLEDGEENPEWYIDSVNMVKDSEDEIKRGIELLEYDTRRNFELRFIRGLFVFTKCEEPETVVIDLRNLLDNSKVDIFNNGTKVYILPKRLNKGVAITRLKKKLGADKVIAAGDSLFDIPMIEMADYAIVPYGLKNQLSLSGNIFIVNEKEMFSEKVLDKVLELCEKMEGLYE
ncbi:MAG: HAD hydrolase family protein [Lachnospiraceae bacterium]|jgi:Predicted hydrolases of the HAD superfamily